MEILYAILLLAATGLLCGVMLALASKYMGVKEDTRVGDIRAMLPGANCGACGYTGCDGYAKALATGQETNPGLCVPGADAVSRQVAGYIGVEFTDVIEKVATVHCNGDCAHTKPRAEYEGVHSCLAASKLHGGFGMCDYGCLGFGDCAAVCPNGAICVEDGIAHVDPRKCTGCGMCTKVCPHHLIDVIPDTRRVVVLCSNKDRGAVTRLACTSGCIGCKKCEKNCPTGSITVTDNLARINSATCINCDVCASNCPVGCILISDNRGIHRFVPPDQIPKA